MDRAPEGLFDFVSRRSPAWIAASRSLNWLRHSKDRLAPFVVLSIALHITVFGLLAVTRGTDPEAQAGAQDMSSARAVKKAVEALRLDARESEALSEALAGLDEDAYEDILERAPELDPRLGERERTEIFRSLMRRSLDRLGTKSGDLSALDFPSWELLPGSDAPERIRSAEGDMLFRLSADRDGRPKLYRLPAKAAKRLESLRAAGDQERGPGEIRGGKIEVRMERGFARVPEEYYFRECPYEQMTALGGSVFYAVSGFPRLEIPDGRASSGEAPGRTPSVPARESRRTLAASAVAVVYLPPAGSREEPVAEAAPIVLPELSEQNVGTILDSLMALSDKDQVAAFMRTYLSGNDPDDPLLAQLTQRFLYENLGGVFNLGDRLATAFDFLEELFFNKMFQNELIDYGLEHSRSRTGTEILLCLAALYDFERRGLAYLADSLDEIEAVLDNKPGRADVFNKEMKAFVLESVYRDLVFGMRSRGLDDLDTVLREYREEQARIYRILIDSGGEAGNRARYALGAMSWDEGQEARALKEWKAIDGAYSTPILERLRWVMSLTYSEDLLWPRINQIFQEESQKSSAAALERLTRFHVWEKRSAKLRAQAVDGTGSPQPALR